MSRFFAPIIQLFDSSGATAGSGTLTFYAQGTTTLQATYSNAARTTPNKNELTVNGSGLSGPIYLQYLNYTVLAKDSDGATLWEEDFDGRWLADGNDYSNSATGSVARTAQSKLDDILSVLDFGAVLDDSTDNYAAIELALTAAAAESKALYFPGGGACRTSDRHVLTAARTGIRIFGDGFNSKIRLTGTHSSNKCVFIIPANGDNDGGTVDGADNVTIENLQLDGSLAVMTTGVSSGIRNFHGEGHIFRNLWTHDFELQGMLLQGIGSAAFSCLIDGWYSYDNDDGVSTGQGLGIESDNVDATRITISNAYLFNNGGTGYGRGFNVGSGSATFNNVHCWGNGNGGGKSSGNDNQHLVYNNCNLSENTDSGAQGYTTTGTFRLIEFNNCVFDNNGDHGLQISHAGKVMINGVYTRGNGDNGCILDTTDCQIGTLISEGNTNQGLNLRGTGNYQTACVKTESNGLQGVNIATTGICHITSIISKNDCTAGTVDMAVFCQPVSSPDLWIGVVNASDSATNVVNAVELNANTSNAYIGKITATSITNEIEDNGTGNIYDKKLTGSATWNPGSIANGAEEAKDITVTGAVLGDFVMVSFSLDVTDLVLNGQVTAADTVTAILANNTGGGIDLGSGTVTARVTKA